MQILHILICYCFLLLCSSEKQLNFIYSIYSSSSSSNSQRFQGKLFRSHPNWNHQARSQTSYMYEVVAPCPDTCVSVVICCPAPSTVSRHGRWEKQEKIS